VALPGIHCEPISTHEAICALPPGHPLAAKPSIRARDLHGQPFITMSRTEGVHELVEGIFQQEKVEVATVAECSMSTAACALVENGVAITLVEQGAATPVRRTACRAETLSTHRPVTSMPTGSTR